MSDRILYLPRHIPERLDINGERTYRTPAGLGKSVTTVLSGTMDKTSLIAWKEDIGEQKANEIVTLAKSRGCRLHNEIDNYVYNKREPKLSLFHNRYWKSAKFFIPRIKTPLLSEGAVWLPGGAAGTLDFLGYLDDDTDYPTLCDWKSADKPIKPYKEYEYKLQVAAYWKAALHVYEEYRLYIPRAIIVVFLPDQKPQIIIMNIKELEQAYIHFDLRLGRYNKTPSRSDRSRSIRSRKPR